MTRILRRITNEWFLHTPKPRELSQKEIKKFNLTYHDGKEIKPSYENTGNVWAAANTGKLPTYRFYNCGTNYLVVLKYTPDKDAWKEIEISEVGTLYSMVWLMCLKLQGIK